MIGPDAVATIVASGVSSALGVVVGVKVSLARVETRVSDHDGRIQNLEKATGLAGETGQFVTAQQSEERWRIIQTQLGSLQRAVDAVALRVDAAIARNQGG